MDKDIKEALECGKKLVNVLLENYEKSYESSDVFMNFKRQKESESGAIKTEKEALKKLTESGKELTSNAEILLKSYEKNSDDVNVIFSKFDELSEQILQIDAAMKGAAVKLSSTKQQAEAITRFTDSIEEISEQTNLLSFNASIEAARAGVAGKGFRIIANEVKKLSDNTQNTAKQIAKSVQELADQIAAISAAQDERNKLLKSMLGTAEESKKALQQLRTDEQQNTSHVQKLLDVIDDNSKQTDIAIKSIKDNEFENEQKLEGLANKTSKNIVVYNDLASFSFQINEVFKFIEQKLSE